MREPPAIPSAALIAALSAAYNFTVAALTFLPLGYDAFAWVYRVDAASGAPCFLKLRRGHLDTAALPIPRYLNDHGIPEVVAPLPTSDGRLWVEIDGYALLLYPFVEGQTAIETGLTPDQWRAFGAVVRRIHAANWTPEMVAPLPRETFIPRLDNFHAVESTIAHAAFADSLSREAAAVWNANRPLIDHLVSRVRALAAHARRASADFVVCHSDIHTANVLVTPSGNLAVVDWDQPMLAPKERDLMFIVGNTWSTGGSLDAQRWFLEGYGSPAIDPVAFAYYRYDWVVQDISEFAGSVLHRFDLSSADRAESLDWLRRILAPGDGIRDAFATEPLLPPDLRAPF